MLTLDGLEIEYRGFRLTADITVRQGIVAAVIGPSGAGKSSLLAAIAGFLPIASGRIYWRDQEIGALPPGKRPISTVFQDNNLFPHLTVLQNVSLGLSTSLRLAPDEREKVLKAIARVGLQGYEGRKPATLSGGQQSRAALARVLVQNRPVVLLDEPFAALGPGLKTEMLDLVGSVLDAQGATAMMVTHDPDDAKRLAAETIVVADGRVHPPKATGPLFADPPPALRSYLGQE